MTGDRGFTALLNGFHFSRLLAAISLSFVITACEAPKLIESKEEARISGIKIDGSASPNVSTYQNSLNLTVQIFAGSVMLSYLQPFKQSPPFTFVIYRAPAGTNSFSQIGQVFSTSFTDTSASMGTAYDYYVIASDGTGATTKSSVVRARPIGAFVLQSMIQDQTGDVTFTWTPAAGADSYSIVYGIGNSQYNEVLMDNVTSPMVVGGIPIGSTYYYRILAKNSEGAKVFSSNIFPASIVGNFSASLDSSVSGHLYLNWTLASGATNYRVMYSNSPGGPYNNTASTSALPPFDIKGLAPLATYYFKVYADGILLSHPSANEVPVYYSIPVNKNWTLTSAQSSSFSYDSSKVAFNVGGYCELAPLDQLDHDNTPKGFGGGTYSGTVYGMLADGTSTGVKLGPDGTCDGTLVSCNNMELAADWTPKWSNLVGYWKLNNDALATVGGAGMNGTPQGATSFVTGAKMGSHAANFTGAAGTSIVIPHHANLNPTAAVTVSAWIRPASIANSAIFDKTNNSNGTNGKFLLYIEGSAIRFRTVSPATVTAVGPALAVNNWYHVVGTFNGSSTAVYVNGVLGSSVAAAGALSSTTGVEYIGQLGGNQYYFNGQIDEVAVWNTALTQTEIAQLYSMQNLTRSGSFLSRIMDATATGMSWLTFQWATAYPYGKELPDGNTLSELPTAYSGMTTPLLLGNQGLWHLNEAAGTTGANSVLDKSGAGNHLTPTAVTLGVQGQLKTAAEFNGTSSYLQVGNATAFQYDRTSTFTVSAWIMRRTATDAVIMRNTISAAPHTGWGLQVSTNKILFFLFNNSSTNQIRVLSTSTIPAGRWVHVTATYNGSGNASGVSLYINGTSDTGVIQNNTLTGSTLSGVALRIGTWSGNTAFFPGSMDEIAIWNRVLAPNEVAKLYARGASRLKFQVRTCFLADCSDGVFLGPDGTSNTYFSETHNMSVQAAAPSGNVLRGSPLMTLANFAAPLPVNRYFQYRTVLETEATSAANMPELKTASVGPNHFDTAGTTIVGNLGMTFNIFTSLNDVLGPNGCTGGGVTYNLGVGSSVGAAIWYWWDGAANSGLGGWVPANGTSAQANTIAVINANAGLFAAQAGTGNLYFKAYLSTDGASQCEIDNLTAAGYSF